MKANHNNQAANLRANCVVVNISSSKNESKSQLLADKEQIEIVVVNISSSKNESKSQLYKRLPFHW
ncbi:hypothetical protein SAMN05421813_1137 [Daejeonella rubra]|uniref:Uncharacterized protein n=1 Tax=Daejeonella rubra TaxID=990371 RepID=A0A1G9TGC7_9SPHI|nr:hypothetical protein [Daejeonella rubra]SDM46663.1 hypothetical protein SAMN05421813_1137 [Daejeonella rubra]